MNEIIKISKEKIGTETVNSVDARALYAFLESKQEFTHWIKNRIEQYGFIQDIDFIQFDNFIKSDSKARQDYALTIDMAKELAMVERTEKGKQARQYFIECEKIARQANLLPNFSNPAEAARAWASEFEKRQIAEKTIEDQKPKVLLADCITATTSTILVGEMAKILKQNGYDTGQNRLYEILRTDGFLIKRSGVDYNMPTQKSMELKLFEIHEGTRVSSTGSKITKTAKVTGKGQEYFINYFLKDRLL